ncbi:VOC family protein [Hydrogenophaga sp. UC242_50]|uniref:VOC family protein n=1 Tax=Hydrogenophaga sp. UC242_50 TaxID=3350169 RepID=UPI0036D2F914
MSSPWIEAVRSVALNVPDLAQAETFYTEVWRLSVAHRGEQAICLRGTGSDHHLLALHAGGPVPQIRQVTLRARSLDALHAVAEAVPRAGGTLLSPIGPLRDDPAGGTGLTLRDPHGRVIQVVHGDARGEDTGPQRDQPARLTHVVLNSHAVDDTQRFLTEALGFTLADRTVPLPS